MLAPHHREDAELSVTRFATAEDLPGVSVLFRRQVVFGNQFGRDGGLSHTQSGFQTFMTTGFCASRNIRERANKPIFPASSNLFASPFAFKITSSRVSPSR